MRSRSGIAPLARWLLLATVACQIPWLAEACDSSASLQLGDRHRHYRADNWPDYQLIIWHPQTPGRLAGLAQLGVTAGRIFGQREKPEFTDLTSETQPFIERQLTWFVENIATDFYSAYHRWHPDRPVNWLFGQVKRLHREQPGNIAAFVRTPSLSDPAALRKIAARLAKHVRAYSKYRPLFYDLADEAGIADLTAAWDFDFAPESLSAMRVWLRKVYSSLAALNTEWGTHFSQWNEVMPMTTDEALRRADGNFAAWSDFKEWMDFAFACAIGKGARSVHAADRGARAGIAGAQPPGWGGYNYTYLANAVDVMEMSNRANSVEIAHALNPTLITLMTSSLADDKQVHTAWRELLLGGRGLVLWDPEGAFVEDDGAPTARGQVLADFARETRSGLAAQLIASRPKTSQIAILYSPVSFRTQWLIDRQNETTTWTDRDSEIEYMDRNLTRSTAEYAAFLLSHLGVQPHWLTPGSLARGDLSERGIRLLILPNTIALSLTETQQIRKFIAHGGHVLTNSEPGVFDEHSRRLARPALGDLTSTSRSISLLPELLEGEYDTKKLVQFEATLRKLQINAGFTVSTPSGEITENLNLTTLQNGGMTIVGIQRDEPSVDSHEKQEIVLRFNAPVYAYNIRHKAFPQFGTQVRLAVEALAPTIVAVSSAPIPDLHFYVPLRAQLNGRIRILIGAPRTRPTAARVVHIQLIPPSSAMPIRSANVVVRGQQGAWSAPLYANEPPGHWSLKLSDALTGRTAEFGIAVVPGPRLRGSRRSGAQ